MRIRGYARISGLSIYEIQDNFGSPSPYRDSRTATLVTGENHQGFLARATVVISEKAGDLVLSTIRALDAGGGSVVMRKICQLADKHGLVVDDLTPSPFPLSRYSAGVRKLHKKELVAFYEGFGFVMGSDKTMSRQPR